MSETLSTEEFKLQTTDWMPGGRLVGDLLPPAEEAELEAIRAQVVAADPNLDMSVFRNQFADPAIIHGLREAEQRTGITAAEFVSNSIRFNLLNRGAILQGHAVIPQSYENVHQDGRPRRHEEGDVVDLDRVRSQGVDPAKVLYYRVTQPSATPKPEYYWTSDSIPARGGFRLELGEQAKTAIVLASTLDTISRNGGLIEDVVDDQGLPVRQIGLGAFDQSDALFSFPRE